MKILVNKEIIKSLNPCTNRYKNYLEHYSDFCGTLEEFLDLKYISHSDKIWVSMRLMPRFLVEVFAIDCAVSSINYASYASYAADDAANADAANAAANAAADAYAAYAAYAAYSATYDAVSASERKRQIESIIYLIQTHEEN